MNAVFADAQREPDLRLRATLIRLCALTDEVVDDIDRNRAENDRSFEDAALELGHVSEEDIHNAHAWGRKIALIERRKVRPSEQLLLAHDPFNARSEQVRALRTELLFRRPHDQRADIVAVMSPCPGEGRSRLAAELAISFAQLGKSTLLVDADLRHPSQHLLFDADNEQGLAQAVDLETPAYVQPVEGLRQLSLLTAGQVMRNPLELLSDDRFAHLIEEWREQYDHVVIDTAPVSEYSDGLAVATLVGRVLTVSRSGATPYRSLKEMMRRLAATHAEVLGAVINRF
jgi:receptor protein-tyrosine kinase